MRPKNMTSAFFDAGKYVETQKERQRKKGRHATPPFKLLSGHSFSQLWRKCVETSASDQSTLHKCNSRSLGNDRCDGG